MPDVARRTPPLAKRLALLPAVVPDLVESRAVLFVGSGFSRALTNAPTWNQLLRHLWADVGENPAVWDPLLSDDPYGQMDVLDTLYLRDWLHRRNGTPPPNPGHPLKIAIHNFFERGNFHTENWTLWERLSALGFCDWVTTNWDTLIETNFGMEDRPPAVLRRGALLDDIARANLEGADAPNKDRPFVLKFHGCLTATSEMVVTRKDLDDFLRGDLYLKSLMVKKLMERTVLYIGYSLQDDNILRVITEVNAEAKRLSRGGALPARQVLFVRSPPGSSPQHKVLEGLGVHVVQYTGLEEFVDAVAYLQKKRPPVVTADKLLLQLLGRQRQYAESTELLGQFGLMMQLAADPGALFGASRGVTAVPDWFRREALPKENYSVHHWAEAFERLLATQGPGRGVSRYVLVPNGKSFQDFQSRVERLLVGIALHVANRHQKRFAKDWKPLRKIIDAIIQHESAGHLDAARILVGIAHYAPDYVQAKFTKRLKTALKTVSTRSSLTELAELYDVFVQRKALSELVVGIQDRPLPNRAIGFLMPLGRILKRLRGDDTANTKKLLNHAKKAATTIGLDNCRHYLSSRQEAIDFGIDEKFAEWLYP